MGIAPNKRNTTDDKRVFTQRHVRYVWLSLFLWSKIPIHQSKNKTFSSSTDANAIACVLAHEVGHVIGLRHSDMYERCGSNIAENINGASLICNGSVHSIMNDF